MDEAAPPGKDDRQLWHTVCTKRDGVSLKKKCQFAKNNKSPWAKSRREVNSGSIQGLQRSVSFMDKMWNRMTATTSPVCLNK